MSEQTNTTPSEVVVQVDEQEKQLHTIHPNMDAIEALIQERIRQAMIEISSKEKSAASGAVASNIDLFMQSRNTKPDPEFAHVYIDKIGDEGILYKQISIYLDLGYEVQDVGMRYHLTIPIEKAKAIEKACIERALAQRSKAFATRNTMNAAEKESFTAATMQQIDPRDFFK
jgi:hypothetical protein